ncbi:hypothetical protein ACF08M_27595 [Streptomyces sp. NPDC015032]|uniref:hypothetical protein n=1 Tax=Streptomyces sp. NPDC015032 TaxID=3364937 RepID=UPI0036F67078
MAAAVDASWEGRASARVARAVAHRHRSEAMIHLAMTDLTARRLASENTIIWRDPSPRHKKQHIGMKY